MRQFQGQKATVGHHASDYGDVRSDRHRAILGLTWDRVNLDARLIDFRDPDQTETRKRRVRVPINDTLLAALVEAKARSESRWVVEWGGTQVLSVKHGFASACKAVGLKDVTPHTLRHTAVTWMLQDGADPWRVSRLAGMTLEVLQDTYGHHHPDHLISVVKVLG